MIQLPFREHPEKSPSGKVSVFGPSVCSVEKMHRYAVRRNPDAPRAAEMYVELGAKYGIRGDVAFCQAMLDTKVWTAAPMGPPVMSLAIQIWGYEPSAWREEELERCVERHFQRLFEAARSEERIVFGWEDLNNRWLQPGRRYGQDILAIWRSMRDWPGGGEEEENAKPSARSAHQVQEKDLDSVKGEEALAWLSERTWTPKPVPHAERKVTWSELARVLREWDGGA